MKALKSNEYIAKKKREIENSAVSLISRYDELHFLYSKEANEFLLDNIEFLKSRLRESYTPDILKEE